MCSPTLECVLGMFIYLKTKAHMHIARHCFSVALEASRGGVSGFRKKLLSSGNNKKIASWRGDILQKLSLSVSQQTPRVLWKPTVFGVFTAVQMRNPL